MMRERVRGEKVVVKALEERGRDKSGWIGAFSSGCRDALEGGVIQPCAPTALTTVPKQAWSHANASESRYKALDS